MGAKNKVVSGKYDGYFVVAKDPLIISTDGFGLGGASATLSKSQISQYELITEERVKSGTSVLLRGAAGAALLGPVGLLAGLTGRKKGIYNVAIKWNDGSTSIIEIDDKRYKIFMSKMW